MMTESTQCIASALRNSIINLGMIPKIVYQDNGRAFKSKFFQNNDFDENIFNGVYANLNIHSVFAKPYNARAKVIERFFLEFQEELEKGIVKPFVLNNQSMCPFTVAYFIMYIYKFNCNSEGSYRSNSLPVLAPVLIIILYFYFRLKRGKIAPFNFSTIQHRQVQIVLNY